MPWMTKDDQTILVDDGAVQYWLDQGWSRQPGGIILDGAEYAAEVSGGQTMAPESNQNLQFDTVSDGLLIDGPTIQGITNGLYVLNYQFEFEQPAEDRFVKIAVDTHTSLVTSVSMTLHSEGVDLAHFAYGQLTVLVIDGTLAVSVQTSVLSDAASPASLVMSYGYIQLNRLDG